MSEGLTDDALFGGRLKLLQRAGGYRFGVDALLLACGLSEVVGPQVLDLGCGVGVVALAAATLHPELSVVGLEVQPSLAELARRNADRNELDGRVTVLEADARQVATWKARVGSGGDPDPPEPTWAALCVEGFDLVLMNPPYFPAGDGRANPDREKAAARHLVNGELHELLRAARLLMRRGGLLRLIYPAEQLPALLNDTARAGLKPIRLRAIHPFPDTPAQLVLLDARIRGRREMTIAPSLALHDEPDVYTDWARRMLQGDPVVL